MATACDAVFPERRGWFTEYYEESRHWAEVPASFRSWPEYGPAWERFTAAIKQRT